MPEASSLSWFSDFLGASPGLDLLLPAAALFIFGFAGSAHCAAMCSPLVCAACGSSPSRATKSVSLLLAIRLVSYSAAGLVAGAFGQLFFRNASRVPGLILLALMGAFALLTAVMPRTAAAADGHRHWWSVFPWMAQLARGWKELSTALLNHTRSLPLVRTRRDVLLGTLFPLLPCGFLWLALAQAAVLGDAVLSASAMAFFALGTTPALVVGHQLAFRLRKKLNMLHPAALRLVAASIALVMWGWTYYALTQGELPCH